MQVTISNRRAAAWAGLGRVFVLVTVAGACARGDAGSEEPDVRGAQASFENRIRAPEAMGAVDVPIRNASGAVVGVACATCHARGGKPAWAERAGAPKKFHVTIALEHGSLGCTSCHAADDREALHLADGSKLPLADAIRLCGQCHGTQFRDYQHGAHGGMTGSWDLTRGPRTRNHCVACHAPHAPAYPLVEPAAGPNDRFLVPKPATRSAVEERFDTKEGAHGK